MNERVISYHWLIHDSVCYFFFVLFNFFVCWCFTAEINTVQKQGIRWSSGTLVSFITIFAIDNDLFIQLGWSPVADIVGRHTPDVYKCLLSSENSITSKRGNCPLGITPSRLLFFYEIADEPQIIIEGFSQQDRVNRALSIFPKYIGQVWRFSQFRIINWNSKNKYYLFRKSFFVQIAEKWEKIVCRLNDSQS